LEYAVVVVDDPEKGLVDGNVIVRNGTERCKHFIGNEPGKYACAIHDHPIYQQTPCFQFDQVGSPDSSCRIGVYNMVAHILGSKERAMEAIQSWQRTLTISRFDEFLDLARQLQAERVEEWPEFPEMSIGMKMDKTGATQGPSETSNMPPCGRKKKK
jgi:hypothetical protein